MRWPEILACRAGHPDLASLCVYSTGPLRRVKLPDWLLSGETPILLPVVRVRPGISPISAASERRQAGRVSHAALPGVGLPYAGDVMPEYDVTPDKWLCGVTTYRSSGVTTLRDRSDSLRQDVWLARLKGTPSVATRCAQDCAAIRRCWPEPLLAGLGQSGIGNFRGLGGITT